MPGEGVMCGGGGGGGGLVVCIALSRQCDGEEEEGGGRAWMACPACAATDSEAKRKH